MAIATLTVDMVAKLGNMQQEMSKATHIAEQNAKRIDEAFSAVKTTIAGLFAGAAVGGAWQSLIVDTARLGAEIDKLSKLSNTNAQDFQLLAYGARTAGVEQDKLADILKDVNDKFGEFAVTGGGELKDFFDTVAKRVGVTADAFKNLSGPEALQLYYDTLQKANVSQQQATFFMEALANDATLLIPLLKDGGAGFKLMADEAQRLGTVMDSKAISAAKEFEANMQRLDSAMQGLKLTIGNALIPTINRLSEEFIAGMRNSNGFWDAIYKYGLTNPFKSQTDSLKQLNTEAAKLEDKISIGRGTDDDRKRLAILQQQINYYNQLDAARTKALGNQLGLGDIGTVSSRPVFTPDSKPDKSKQPKAGRTDDLGDWLQDLEARIKPAEDALKRFRDLQLDAAVSGADLTRSERAFYDLINTPEWQSMGEPWKDLVRVQFEAANAAEKAAAETARLNELLAATDSAKLEKTRADMDLLAKALEDGRISAEQFEEAANAALGNVADKGKQDFDELSRIIDGWGKDSAKSIASALTSGKASLADFADFANRILSDVLAQMLYKNVTGPATTALSNANWGAMFGFANGGIMTSAGPLPLKAYASGGVATSPQIALFGEGRMNEAFVPLPDGRSIPVTMKGQGSGGVQAVRVEIINETSQPARAASVQPTLDVDGMVVRVVLRDLNNNGPIRQALGA